MCVSVYTILINVFHRVTHLGSHLMNELEKQDVLTTRRQTSKAYEVSELCTYTCLPYILYQLSQHYRRVPVVTSECGRSITECCLGRTFRDTNQNQVYIP